MRGRFENLEGRRYGKLTVIAYAGRGKHSSLWHVRCDCGACLTVDTGHLGKGRMTACSKECRYPDISGKQIGSLLILGRAIKPDSMKHGLCWHCRCLDCGREFVSSTRMINSKGSCICKSVARRFKRKNEFSPAMNSVIWQYRRSAQKRGLPFDLTPTDAYRIFHSPCHYCGRVPSQVRRTENHEFWYNGIDRVDSSVGYVRGNVVPCCKICNLRKGKLSASEFRDWVTSVYRTFCRRRPETAVRSDTQADLFRMADSRIVLNSEPAFDYSYARLMTSQKGTLGMP